ncbi:hypothetical protein VTP01DRAFT_7509 [Rhizomucor pusillus]|uniref:uncharacterized protein n=1 Tax=Rhizomucor pusillus TaxID=4840 RepID=UPI00374307AF
MKRAVEREEEERVCQKKQKCNSEDDESFQDGESDVQSEISYDKEIQITFWHGCRRLLEEVADDEDVNIYNPEEHGIIVCGDHIRPNESSVPVLVYEKAFESTKYCRLDGKFRDIFVEEKDYVARVLNAEEPEKMLREARRLPETADEKKTGFLSDMLIWVTRDIYKAKADLTHSEIKLNTCVIWPAMKASINAIDTNHHLHFYPGEERLISMER